MLSLIENLFFYTECSFCGNIDEIYIGQNSFCKDCIDSIKKEHIPYCKHCGKLTSSKVCTDCKIHPLFDEVGIFTKYEGILREIILEYKFNNNKKLAKVIGNVISNDIKKFIEKNQIDIVLYVPSTKKKEKERGFSHLKEILLNTGINKRLIKDFIVKIKSTPLQVEVSSEERERNLKDAFILKEINSLENKNILIFDDIITTGSTLKEVCKTVKKVKKKGIFAYIIST